MKKQNEDGTTTFIPRVLSLKPKEQPKPKVEEKPLPAPEEFNDSDLTVPEGLVTIEADDEQAPHATSTPSPDSEKKPDIEVVSDAAPETTEVLVNATPEKNESPVVAAETKDETLTDPEPKQSPDATPVLIEPTQTQPGLLTKGRALVGRALSGLWSIISSPESHQANQRGADNAARLMSMLTASKAPANDKTNPTELRTCSLLSFGRKKATAKPTPTAAESALVADNAIPQDNSKSKKSCCSN